MVRRLRLTVGYLGTRYAGWEVQPPAHAHARPTLQGTLETALHTALGHPVRVTAAGRTDAGVHAEGQVVSFDTTSSMGVDGLRRVLSHWLPEDLWVIEAAEAASDFDARRSAMRRWYRYALWRTGAPPAAWQARCLVTDEPLDVPAMRRAAGSLLGRHDFASLATRPPAGQSTVRTIFAADWLQMSPTLLIFEIGADAYLKQMVRAIVGGLLWVGRRHWTAADFAASIGHADRRAGGPNAPATGLTLHRIEY